MILMQLGASRMRSQSFFAGDQLNGLDAVFLFLESKRTPMHVGGLYIYDPSTTATGELKFEDVVAYVSARTHLAKPFRKKLSRVPLSLDFPYWVEDEDFSADRHFRYHALTKPNGWNALSELVAKILAEPLDLSIPLWQFNFISGLDNIPGTPKGAVALLTKAHHAAIDGASGVDIDTAIHSIHRDPPAPPPDTRPTGPRPNALTKVVRAQINAMTLPWRSADTMRALSPGLFRVASGVLMGDAKLPPMRAPFTRFNRNISGKRTFGAATLPFETIKRIREAVHGVTVNDVVLAIVSGAMRDYLDGKNELPSTSMSAMAPISVRSNRDASATGNDVANMAVSLGSDLDDPRHRLSHIHESANNSKQVTATLGAKSLSEASKNSAPWLANASMAAYSRLGVNALSRPSTNTTVTNVPGPRVPLYLNGAQLIAQYNLAPLMHGMGLVHTVFSYNGMVTITFASCPDMISDPREYEACLQNSLEDLLKACSVETDIPAPNVSAEDDLTQIKGIGPIQAKRLNSMGFRTFEALGALKRDDIARLAGQLNGHANVARWVADAIKLQGDDTGSSSHS